MGTGTHNEYDEEWRMIANRPMQPPVVAEWVPSSIILGLRMRTEEKNLVISMAKEAGIREIYQSHISSDNHLRIHSV